MINKFVDRRQRNINYLREIISYCKKNEYFRVGIYISDKSKFITAENLLKDAINGDGVSTIKISKSPYDYIVEFLETKSFIKVVPATSSARGNRFNFAFVDTTINKQDKDTIILPKIMPVVLKDGNYRYFPVSVVEIDL